MANRRNRDEVERGDLLRLGVEVDFEVIACEPDNVVSLGIRHHCIRQHEVDRHADAEIVRHGVESFGI
jgi:hypothetical protein